ncbi:DUF6531 domain-containing protein [Bdellovibrio sp.]|uniref:DUF6531 domain-containing protein n=1 Tax=Bdellovibrio sp. TaxID=28201 RepID=UPI003221E700
MFKTFALVFVLVAANFAFAVVDTSTGSFVHSWTDFEGRGMDLRLSLVRTYHSRSNHRGWFGYGWCTDLETNLKRGENSLEINHCGDGRVITFRAERGQFKGPKSSDGIVKKVDSTYKRTFPDGTVEIFNSEGNLNEIRKGKLFVRLKYNNKGIPSEIADSGGRLVNIESNPQGNISLIQFLLSSRSKEIKPVTIGQYSYEGGNLVEAKNAWGNTYGYQYDKKNNMVVARWPSGKSVQISYNNNDWVQSVSGSEICKESYSYKIDNSRNPPRYEVTVKKDCPDGIKVELAYAYTYSLDNSRVVAADIDEGAVKREYIYDGDDVVKVIEHRGEKNQIVTTIKRNAKGQIVSIANPFETKRYSYKTGSSRDLVVKTEIELTVLGKVVSLESYSFGYDENDRLVFAMKPDKTKVEFKWSDEDVLTQVRRSELTAELVYGSGNEVTGIKFRGKILPINIYAVEATAQEIAVVETYVDFHRMQRLTIPSY